MSVQTLTRLHQRLEPLTTVKMPLSSPPPRRSRFGGPLALSKVHWVRPELVAEITYLGWTDEPLLRHTVFVGLREDKPAREVRREVANGPWSRLPSRRSMRRDFRAEISSNLALTSGQ